jgi:RND family efflux transporter MFP subunit
MAGSTSQAIQLAQLSVQADQEALTNASTSLQTVIEQQKQDVANALSTLLNSGLQAEPGGSNAGNGTLAISGNYTDTQQGTYTVTVFNTGGGLEYVVSGLENATGQVNKTTTVPLGTKGLYMQFAGNIYNNDSWTIAIPNNQSSNYISNQSSYQTAITNEASAISNAQNSLTSAQNKVQQDQINLQVEQEPPTNQQVESAQASLTQAQASLQNAQITYDNNILKAPFDGQVAQLNNQVGDQVSASTAVAVLTNNQSEAIIPLNEVDVASVKLGDKATMTFDAVPNLTISGTVVEIDNIGTVSQGVVNYNVKVTFDVENPQVKPGMSVDVAIITDAQPDVLSVPSAAIKTQGNLSYVLTLNPSQTQTVPGETGVTSTVAPKMVVVQTGVTDGTNTQITSGLNQGDTVVTQTISSAKTTTAAATTGGGLGIPGLGGGAAGGGAGFRAGGGGLGGGAARGGG